MNNESKNASGGIGFCGALTIVFIVLKLLGKITWSWLWVLSPIWIGFLLFLSVLGIIIVVMVIKNKMEEKRMDKIMERYASKVRGKEE